MNRERTLELLKLKRDIVRARIEIRGLKPDNARMDILRVRLSLLNWLITLTNKGE